MLSLLGLSLVAPPQMNKCGGTALQHVGRNI